MIFFTVFYFSNIEDLKAIFLAQILVLFVEVFLGIWELTGGYHLYGSFPQYYLKHNLLPVIGTFGHPNNFATYLSMYLPLLYVWGKYQKNRPMMFCSFGILALGLYLITASTSRANMMAMILGLVLAIVLSVIQHWGQFYRIQYWGRLFRDMIKRTIIGVVIVIILAGFIYPLENQHADLAPNQLKEQVMSVFVNWDNDSSIRVRKILILKGLDMLKDTYGLGVGAGSSQFIMEQYQDETFGFIKMHNWWVEVLVDYGVIIWVLLLLFFARMLWDLFKIFCNSRHRNLQMWSEGLIISLCMFSLGVISNGSIMSSAHMWILLSLALCVINVSEQHDFAPN
ncbi:MAG: O-antigen ligase family protein [Bacillota bacterium]